MRLLSIILAASLGTATPSAGQMLADTTFTWQGYGAPSICRIRVYRSAATAGRPFTVVLDELAENAGRTTLDDAAHLVELVARTLEVAPDSAYWIFHWGAFSFSQARPSDKEVYFRATFRRTGRGSTGSASWRLIDRADVGAYTDRAYR